MASPVLSDVLPATSFALSEAYLDDSVERRN